MKTHFLNKLLPQPWHIDRGAGRRVIGDLTRAVRGERPSEDNWGEPLPKMQILDDVALIPLVGALLVNVPAWIKSYGLALTDANDIGEELLQAVNNPEVRFIALDVDSGGGLAIAGDKLFDLVESANKKKPVFAFCADGNVMGSAAYEAAAPTRAIFTGKYATVGSIGSYCVVLDDTEMWKMMGMSWEVFRSGEIKGLGEDSLSEPQKAFIQEETDEAGARFRKNVAKYRDQIAEEDMRGQYYLGEKAAARGFTAGTVRDLGAALAKFRKLL